MTLIPPVSGLGDSDRAWEPLRKLMPAQSPLVQAINHNALAAEGEETFERTSPVPSGSSSAVATGQATVSATRGPQTTRSEADTEGFATREVADLIRRINPNGVSFKDLQNFPFSRLNPKEQDILQFLLRDQATFLRMARLDQDPGTLSPEDIKLTALAGDPWVLTASDLEALRAMPDAPEAVSGRAMVQTRPADDEASAQRTSRQKSEDWLAKARRQPEIFGAQRLNETLQKLSNDPQGLSLQALLAAQPARHRDDWRDADDERLGFLQSEPIQRLLRRLTPGWDVWLLPETLRILTSLIYNPFAAAMATPMILWPSAVGRRGPVRVDALEGPVALEGVTSSPVSSRFDAAGPRQGRSNRQSRVALPMAELCELFQHIGDGQPSVTYAQILAYRPRNAREGQLLGWLFRKPVFESLAKLDGERSSISQADIRIAVADGALILADPYVALMITD